MVIWSVPPPGAGGHSSRGVLDITPSHALFPQAPCLLPSSAIRRASADGGDNAAAAADAGDSLMPVRALVARAVGGPMAPFRIGPNSSSGNTAGVIGVIGGESVAMPDPARLVSLAVDPSSSLLCPAGGGLTLQR